MNKLKYEKSHTSYYMDKIDNVIEWLSNKGLKVECSRYSKYKEYINNFYKTKNFDELESNFSKLNLAFQECVEIVQVYEAFMDEESVGFNNRLKQVVKGRDFFESDCKQDQPRDYLYELIIAARFKSKGFVIDFDQVTDVVASKENVKLFVECKRIKSNKALEENFRKAGKQLERVADSDHYGFIFIDIYNCIANKLRDYEYNSIPEMYIEVKQIVNKYCHENKRLIGELTEKYRESSLAVCFTVNHCLWLSNVTPQYFRDIDVTTYESITDEDFEKVKDILGELAK